MPDESEETRRETVRAFLMDHFEKNRWFVDRVSRHIGVSIEGPVGLNPVMVVKDPEQEGGLMVAFHTDDMLEPSDHGVLYEIADESFAALRERHPGLADVPLRTYISH